MKIGQDVVATIHYTLRDPEGEILDSSSGADPLAYLHGHGQIVVGLERALAGKGVGDKVDVVVSPEDGYGTHDDSLDLAIPKTAFPDEMLGQLEPSVQFVAEHPADDDQMVMYTVLGVEEERVLVTGNHPLADTPLHFNVEVKELRAASAEELEHGHVHGPGGHHH
ncbi:MAG: FKBP-type peptidyl-prolyl cis-trans isomerase [Myxococcales bacterium]|nr:FKBP-type peptidyl-prolyl cis-trans isomerase [Myxococcales bacterium]